VTLDEILAKIDLALRGVFPEEAEMDAAFDAATEALDELRARARSLASAFEAGYVREASNAYNPGGVRWWMYAADLDGLVFARGGRVATEQVAASELAAALGQLDVERRAWRDRRTHELIGDRIVRRFTHELLEDGSLRPLVPTDFEVDG